MRARSSIALDIGGLDAGLEPPKGSGDDGERLGGPAEDLAGVLGDDDQVLDAHAAAAGDVDARLDRDHVPPRQVRVLAARQPRTLVDLEADAVTEAVAEVVLVSRRGDQVACDRVDLAPGWARPDGRERRLLRAAH